MYNTKFILSFSNELNEDYDIYFDFLGYSGGITPIYGTKDCLKIRSTGGDQDRFAPILGTEILIQTFVGKLSIDEVEYENNTLTLEDLIAEHDNDIRVTIYKDGDLTKSIYQGFVVVEDNSRPLLDPPYTLSIRVLDGLGLLKHQDMTDANGNLFNGILSIVDWVGNVLYKTGQSLNLRVSFPFYPAGATESLCALQQVFLDATTWQKGEITTSTDPTVDVFASEADDAYSVLEKMARCLRCRIFQEDGVWNMFSVYSHMLPGGIEYVEFTGTLISGVYSMTVVNIGHAVKLDVPVGSREVIHPANDDAELYLKLATKWEKFNFNYDQSFNKICNQNLNQGDPDPANDGTISSTIEDPSITPPVTFTYKGYEDFCWTNSGGTVVNKPISPFLQISIPFPKTAFIGNTYIRSVLDLLSYEENRYLVIDSVAQSQFAHSSKFLIDRNDALEVSFDFRTRDNVGASAFIETAFIYLNGDDGSFWALGKISLAGDIAWVQTDSNYQALSGGVSPYVGHLYTNGTGDASDQWKSYTVSRGVNDSLLQTPVSGSAFIVLNGLISGLTSEAWFKNIQITIHPYLQGSYTQLKGDYNYSASNNNIKQTDTQDVEISDSPKRYFKGALVDSTHELIPPTWHRKGVVESYRFTQLMQRLVYNTKNRITKEIEGSFRGLTYVTEDLEVKQAGYLNRYHFTDDDPDKTFELTSFDKDYGTGIGRHVFMEILEDLNDTGFDLPDDYRFQYLFQ